MSRYIDADEQREGFMEMVYEQLQDDTDNIRANLIIEYYDSMPTVDAVSVVHGLWETAYDEYGDLFFKCSFCGFMRNIEENFGRAISCPNCGARMDGIKFNN